MPDRFGRAKRGKVWKHWLAAHGAARQAQVRAKDFFGSNLFLQKVAIPCDFDEVCSDLYPVLERFEPIILLLFNPRHFLLQRLLFEQQNSFLLSVGFSFDILF
ncbi:hypothetical protein IT399_01735 [Candidatus Nomurabacteria bacterium]|nr:hypothetical protein [Candidatus Nomurabacteria bacterium]